MILASGGDPEAVITLLHVNLSLPNIVYDVNPSTCGSHNVASGCVGTVHVLPGAVVSFPGPFLNMAVGPSMEDDDPTLAGATFHHLGACRQPLERREVVLIQPYSHGPLAPARWL